MVRTPRLCRRRGTGRSVALSLFLLSGSWMFFTSYTLLKIYADTRLQTADERRVGDGRNDYIGRGVEVVTGYFKDTSGNFSTANLTDEEVNQNNYLPIDDAGAMGRPFSIDSPVARLKSRKYFKINQFNIIASDSIPLNRSLPDVRKQACKDVSYSASLPTTTVIIVFHNEAWSALMRTVVSVINRSPPSLLKGIVLVDDASTRSFLRKPLETATRSLPVPVTIRRSKKRIGLIRARLLGAEVAQGDVLTFLDSHCEVTTGWLQPLLHRIQENPRAFVCPVIDVINDQTFAYQRGIEAFRGAFNWNLLFRWYSVPAKWRSTNPLEPISSPTMAGGLFAASKKSFYEMGSYDEGMNIWGGENLEMSFRVWQCGGSIEILPCSHVGHIFRHASPHDMPGKQKAGDILTMNLVRMAEVWMDDWKDIYYRLSPKAKNLSSTIDVSDRKRLREKLKCKDFQWYLKNVFPDHFLPLPGDFFGQIKLSDSENCLEVAFVAGAGGSTQKRASVGKCSPGFDQQQLWILTKSGFLRTNEHQCLGAQPIGQSWVVQLRECSEHQNDTWSYDKSYRLLQNKVSKLYLAAPTTLSDGETNPPVVVPYGYFVNNIKWNFVDVNWRL